MLHFLGRLPQRVSPTNLIPSASAATNMADPLLHAFPGTDEELRWYFQHAAAPATEPLWYVFQILPVPGTETFSQTETLSARAMKRTLHLQGSCPDNENLFHRSNWFVQAGPTSGSQQGIPTPAARTVNIQISFDQGADNRFLQEIGTGAWILADGPSGHFTPTTTDAMQTGAALLAPLRQDPNPNDEGHVGEGHLDAVRHAALHSGPATDSHRPVTRPSSSTGATVDESLIPHHEEDPGAELHGDSELHQGAEGQTVGNHPVADDIAGPPNAAPAGDAPFTIIGAQVSGQPQSTQEVAMIIEDGPSPSVPPPRVASTQGLHGPSAPAAGPFPPAQDTAAPTPHPSSGPTPAPAAPAPGLAPAAPAPNATSTEEEGCGGGCPC